MVEGRQQTEREGSADLEIEPGASNRQTLTSSCTSSPPPLATNSSTTQQRFLISVFCCYLRILPYFASSLFFIFCFGRFKDVKFPLAILLEFFLIVIIEVTPRIIHVGPVGPST